MNKNLLKLLNQINEKKALVQSLANENKLEEAKTAKEELKELQNKFDILKDLEDEDFENMQQKVLKNQIEPGAPNGLENNAGIKAVQPLSDNGPKDVVKEFANAARTGFKNAMSEGSKVDGGYVVPEDIQTKINERREAKTSLIDLVDVENVTTNKGSRTYKKRTQQTGFTKVGEGAKIGGKATPKFERIDYEISKYAGYFPVTNELLEDTDANVVGTLVAWIGDESRVTRNNIIIDKIKEKEVKPIADLDAIKKVLNVDLGQAFKPTSKIITNDDGLNWLDCLKDADGRYLLQADPTALAKMQLRVGATTVPVEVIPNSDLASDVATKSKRKIPFMIGDLKEGIKFFDRKQTTIMTSNIAQVGELNAFEEDLTLYRAIEREDCQWKDKDAVYYCELTLNDSTVVGSIA